ncbi:MAG: 1,4-dihydroxy-2-naphthoate polyprenyltransferase [Gemmatimonadota bacterium]|nr:1,4-dihydroxy-2-naphthoate polyprenyltransferase [Gemmatimonadota bacterium]
MTVSGWVAGARPRTLPAAIAPVLMGGGLARSTGEFAALPWLAALGGALCIQIGTNFANDYSDFVRGADTDARLGAPRVTQTGVMTPAAVRGAAALFFLFALLIGVYLVARGGWPIVVIGLASIVAGVCYTGGPWPFGYHGLGDLFVWLFFGPVAVAGTVYVQSLEWSVDAILAGAGVGALITAILVVNNLRDIETDRAAGKRTLAVILGAEATGVEYRALILASMIVPVLGAFALGWPVATLAALLGPAITSARRAIVHRYDDPRELNPALPATARAAGLYGLLFAAGCLL